MMKKLDIHGKVARMAATLLVAVAGLAPLTSCDKYDDTELRQQITDINDRLTALEEDIDVQLKALKAIIDGKTTILSCLYDEETGMYTITLTDEDNTVIEVPAVGNDMAPVISYIEEEDGTKYWAVVSEGGEKTAIVDADGNRLKVGGETPALRLGAEGEWMISADGATWTGLGVTSEDVAIFAKAEETETSVIFTLTDGTELEISKYDGSAATFYPLAGSLYFTAGEEKTVEFSLDGIVNIAVQEVPYGWYAKTTRTSMTVRAPGEDKSDADQNGTVKILGVTSDGKSFISEVYVSIGTPDVSIVLNSDRTFSITMQGSTTSFKYMAMKIDDYSADDVVNSLIWEAKSSSEDIINASLADLLGAEPEDGYAYIVWAIADEKYNAADIVTSDPIQPVMVDISVSDLRYDNAMVNVSVTGVNSFAYGYIVKGDDYPTFEEVLAAAELEGFWQTMNYGSTLSAQLNGFYWDTPAVTGADYIIWVLPIIGSNNFDYTAEDFHYVEISLPDLLPGGSVTPVVSEVVTEKTSLTAKVEATGAYKVYAQWYTDADYEAFADEAAIVADVTLSSLLDPASISLSNLPLGESGRLVVLAVDNDGKYAMTSLEADLKTVTWSDMTIELGELELGMTSVAIPVEVSGGTATSFKYINMDRELFNSPDNQRIGWSEDLDVMEKYLAGVEPGEFGFYQNGVTVLPDEKMDYDFPEDNVIRIDWLQTGTEYIFYLVALDEDDNPTRCVTMTYTPGVDPSLITRKADADYEYGKPQITFTSASAWDPTKPLECMYDITVQVTLPSGCKECYLSPVEDYLLADWANGFYNVISDPYGCGAHIYASQEVTVSMVPYGTYIGVVWLDDKGKYHETYTILCDAEYLGIQ